MKDYFDKKFSIFKKIKSRRSEIRERASVNKEPKKRIETCVSCQKLFTYRELENNLYVCPSCNHHYTFDIKLRIDSLFDSYEIIKLNLKDFDPLNFPEYREKKKNLRSSTGYEEGLILVKGIIGGSPLYSFFMNPVFMMGSMGQYVGKGIVKCFDMARSERLPVLGVCASGGARMQEGIFSLVQMANTSFGVREHSDEGNLFLALLTDPTTGGVSASFASLADIIIGEPKARIGFTGRRVIEQTIRQKLPEDFQTSEFLFNHGFLDDIVQRKDQKKYISKILAYHRR